MAQQIDIIKDLIRGSERLNIEKKEIKAILKILEEFLHRIGYDSVEARRNPKDKYTLHLEPFKEVFSLEDESGNKLRFSAGDSERIFSDGDDFYGESELSFIYKNGEKNHKVDSSEFNNLPAEYVSVLYDLLPKLVTKVIELNPKAEKRLAIFHEAAKRAAQ